MANKNRLVEKYKNEVTPELIKEYSIKNPHAVPMVGKVVVNMGVGDMSKNKEQRDSLVRDLATITGQKPSVRAAKISVASFSLRKGMPVGLTITLRGDRMYSFLDKLFSIVLPRLRDFRGVKTSSFDKKGNYTLALTEHTVFPEIDLSKSASPRGLEISIVTNSDDVEKSKRMLELMGMPFEKE